MIITLSDQWLAKAADVGHARHLVAVERGYQHYGSAPRDVRYDITGAIAECAVAKYLGMPWRSNIGVIDAGDVGSVEVRGTRRWPSLPIRPNDKNEPPYVRVMVREDNSAQLLGWLYGYEGKGNPEYWHERSGCWYNPVLRPMSELLELLDTLERQ